MAHNIKPGVATGDQVQEIFNYAKEKGFALPAVNVTGSSTINGVLETAAKLNAPVIIQFSNGGAQFNAGKGLSNANGLTGYWMLQKRILLKLENRFTPPT